jgi:hypothetical protein
MFPTSVILRNIGAMDCNRPLNALMRPSKKKKILQKYDIQGLKQICVKELRRKLTVDNAVDILIFSDLHQANDLKDGAMRFINKNAAAVMKTPSWINFPKSHQHLVLELYSKLFE